MTRVELVSKRKMLDVIKKARKLITKSCNWTKGCTARDKNDGSVNPYDKNAVKFCAIGAIHRMSKTDYSILITIKDKFERIVISKSRYAKLSKYPFMGGWNDSSTHRNVLRGFDKLISKLEEEIANNK
jgi:hypothetical protein